MEVGTKKRPRPGTPRSGPFFSLARLGSLLDPLTCERSNSRSLTLLRAVGGSGCPSALGLQRRPASPPSASQAPRPDRLPSRRYPARWLTSLLSLRMTYAIVHTGRIKNVPPLCGIHAGRSRIICLRKTENMFYGVTPCDIVGYRSVNSLYFPTSGVIVNILI